MPVWRLHRRPKRVVTFGADGRPYVSNAGYAVLASAALISREQVRTVVGRRQDWQQDAWQLYDTVPELRFGTTWVASACSRARLYIGLVDTDGSSEPVPITDETPGLTEQQYDLILSPLNELCGGQLGQAEMLRRLAVHLNVPGESYLVGFDDPEHGRRWLVCSSDEVQSSGNAIKIHSPDIPNTFITVDPAKATLIRIWRPHPRYGYQADSPLIALRQPLRELIDLSAHITASAESRLAGAGVLFVPDELTVPAPEQSEGVNPLHSEPFTAALIEAMAAPLKNRDSASAVVPMVIRGPASAGKELKHLTFSTDLDANVEKLRESAIRRVATGMDIPPEVLTGLGDTNHWGAWQIEESAIKLHIEPLLGLICDSLTDHFLHPALKSFKVPDPERYVIWYDTTDLTLRPNRAPEALQAYDKALISDAATRRELGFAEEDAPDSAEQTRRLAVQVALANPQLAPFLLPALGVDVPGIRAIAIEQVRQGAVRTTTPDLRAPSQEGITTDTPSRNALPTQPTSAPQPEDGAPPVTAALEAGPPDWRTRCLDMAVNRALERAGQYLIRSTPRNQRARLQQMHLHRVHLELPADPHQLDDMLAGAYKEFQRATPGETCLHLAVDNYVRALLLAREQHRTEYLSNAIAQFRCDDPDGPVPRGVSHAA